MEGTIRGDKARANGSRNSPWPDAYVSGRGILAGVKNETCPAELLPRLRCPACRATVAAADGSLACSDAGCGLRFPVVDGAPVLIDERHSLFRAAEFQDRQLGKRRPSRGQALAHRWLPSLDLNVAARHCATRLGELLFARASRPEVLNIGGKHAGAAMARWRRDARLHCIECDAVPGPGVAVVTDPRRLPFADASFDAVLVDGVLEHGIEPRQITDEIHRVLRPRGLVYADTPFLLPVHGGAYDFQRFSELAHRRLFAAFRPIEAGVSSGPAAALGHAIQSVLLAAVQGRRARFAMKVAARLGLFWIKYLDLWLARRPGARDAALGFYFLGERTDQAIDDRQLLQSYVGTSPDLYARAPTATTTR